MDKKYILEKFLSQKGSSIEDVKKIFDNEMDNTIFLYTSYFEGLGNEFSDIDAYILTDKPPKNEIIERNKENYGMNLINKDNLSFDIEYWDIKKIEEYIECINNNEVFNYEEMKCILRIYYSFSINDRFNIKNKIKFDILKDRVYNYYCFMSRAYLDDAIKMYKSLEYSSALLCINNSIYNAVGAYNTANGHVNLKDKWISKILLDNNGFGDEDIIDNFKNLILNCNINDNLQEYLLKMFEFCQNVLNKCEFIK